MDIELYQNHKEKSTQCEILVSKSLKEYFMKIKEVKILKEEKVIIEEELE